MIHTAHAVTKMRKTSDSPLGIGQIYVKIRTMFGKRLEGPVIITDYELYRKITFERMSGPIRSHGTYLFEATPSGTILTLFLDVPLRGGWKIATSLIALLLMVVKRGAIKEFAQLRQVLENSSP